MDRPVLWAGSGLRAPHQKADHRRVGPACRVARRRTTPTGHFALDGRAGGRSGGILRERTEQPFRTLRLENAEFYAAPNAGLCSFSSRLPPIQRRAVHLDNLEADLRPILRDWVCRSSLQVAGSGLPDYNRPRDGHIVLALTSAMRQMSRPTSSREVKAIDWPVSHVRSHLRKGIMVIVMGGSSQLCCYCNEVTERTSDGDRLACSMCGRPYLVAPDQPIPYDRPG